MATFIGVDTYCEGVTVNLNDLILESDLNGEWFDSEGQSSSNEITASTQDNQTFTYVVSADPCPSVSTEVTFNVIQGDVPGVPNGENTEFCNEDSVVINLDTFLDGQDDGGQWSDSNGNDISANVTLVNLEAGSYDFTYTIFNPDCGNVTATITLQLSQEACDTDDPDDPEDPVLPDAFAIPQGFSPNGDGINDVFEITGLNEFFPNNSIQIFNRWGAEILNAAPYNNDWAGKAETGLNAGELLPVGTYWYILDLGDNSEPIIDFIYLNR